MHTRKLAAILGLLLVYNLFFFHPGVPLPGTLGFVLMVITGLCFIWLSLLPKKLNSTKVKLALAATATSLILVSISLIRANYFDRFYLSLSALGLSLVTIYLLALTHHHFGALSEIIHTPLLLAVDWFSQAINTASKLTSFLTNRLKSSNPSPDQQSKLILGLIRGTIITLPAALILLALLSSADPVFNQFVTDIFNFKLPQLPFDLTNRLISSTIILALFTPAAYFSINRKFFSPLNLPQYARFGTELSMLTATTVTILTAFLIIQFPYLFSNVSETQLHQFGVQTYSEYVRRGFIELALVGALTYTITGLAFLVIRAQNFKPTFLKKINLILLGETLIFILSIFRRLYLYQTHHGLTRVRVYGIIFLLTLISITFTMILRHFRQLTPGISTTSGTKKSPKNNLLPLFTNFDLRFTGYATFPFYLIESSIILVAIISSGLLNVDHLIATQSPPTVNGEVDYTYIARLSPDAADQWLESYKWAKTATLTAQAKDFQSITTDEKRHLFYANQIFYSLKNHYIDLNRKFGIQTFQDILTQNYHPDNHLKQLINNRPFHTNLSELHAYQSISTIDPQELIDLTNTAQNLQNILISPQDYPFFDRSPDSPLL